MFSVLTFLKVLLRSICIREKAAKCSLKTTKVLLDADGHVLA